VRGGEFKLEKCFSKLGKGLGISPTLSLTFFPLLQFLTFLLSQIKAIKLPTWIDLDSSWTMT
jgi:hypothetical protein